MKKTGISVWGTHTYTTVAFLEKVDFFFWKRGGFWCNKVAQTDNFLLRRKPLLPPSGSNPPLREVVPVKVSFQKSRVLLGASNLLIFCKINEKYFFYTYGLPECITELRDRLVAAENSRSVDKLVLHRFLGDNYGRKHEHIVVYPHVRTVWDLYTVGFFRRYQCLPSKV